MWSKKIIISEPIDSSGVSYQFYSSNIRFYEQDPILLRKTLRKERMIRVIIIYQLISRKYWSLERVRVKCRQLCTSKSTKTTNIYPKQPILCFK